MNRTLKKQAKKFQIRLAKAQRSIINICRPVCSGALSFLGECAFRVVQISLFGLMLLAIIKTLLQPLISPKSRLGSGGH